MNNLIVIFAITFIVSLFFGKSFKDVIGGAIIISIIIYLLSIAGNGIQLGGIKKNIAKSIINAAYEDN